MPTITQSDSVTVTLCVAVKAVALGVAFALCVGAATAKFARKDITS